MKIFTFLIVFMILTATNLTAQMPPIEAGVSQKLANWRGQHYSDVRYKLNITLEKGAPLMKGEIEIRVKLTEEGAKNPLILDWRTTQFQNDKDKPFANVVAVNGTGAQAYSLANAAFFSGVKTFSADKLELNTNAVFALSRSLQAGTLALQSLEKEHLIIPKELLKTGENVITIQFASPIKTSGAAITRYVDKEDGAEYVYSLFVPSDASTAFPVFDQPDLKARFKLTVSVPASWKVVTNTDVDGTRITESVSEEEKKRNSENKPADWQNRSAFLFAETKPISTYVFAFAAGDFVKVPETGVITQSQKNMQTVINNDYINPQTSTANLETSAVTGGTNVYVRKSQAEKFKAHEKEVFRLNREGVKYLESYFDYKFPFPKYDLVLIPEFPFGGMEHAGATFLRESSVIFPQEPTKNDFVSRANLIFHEAAHQWFGDTVTMKWFDDLWLKEGFAEFMAYKTLAQVMPEYNAWKIFYERNKQLAYLTDSTRGTTQIYQEITNLSSAKSAYGNIVYRKAPSFLKQAEFFLGEKEFQTAVRAFLKKHEFANAEWTDLVKEFETASKQDLKDWANVWVKTRGVFKFSLQREPFGKDENGENFTGDFTLTPVYKTDFTENKNATPLNKFKALIIYKDKTKSIENFEILPDKIPNPDALVTKDTVAIIPNYQDYGYGIFLLDEKSRAYVLENIQNEKDDFLRTMMWGALWDSVREGELAPKTYVELVIKNINTESDESTIQTLLNRVGTAMNYYLNDKQREEIAPKLETLLIEKMQKSETLGQRITFYRAFLNLASSENARQKLKEILNLKFQIKDFKLKTKDKFDIITKLIILGDKDALNLLTELEKTETSDEAKRYAYAAKAGIGTAENKLKFWNDFVSNKDISESWIEAAFVSFNSPKHADLTLPYLEKALAELPNLKRNRKIFFVNGWLASFIGGQRSEEALKIVNKFLADNPNLDKDLRLKILENVDLIERAVKIRGKFGK